MRFISATTVLALPLLAVATTTVTVHPTPTPSPLPASNCTTGPIQCCNSLSSVGTGPVSFLLGLLGIVIQGVTAPIGLTCSGITLGVGGNSCSAQTVCCEHNQFNGLIALGCTPVNINL